MKPTETVRLACISVGIDPELANAAALAHARMVAAPQTEMTREFIERIKQRFDFSRPPGMKRMTATEVCAAIGIERPTRSQQTAAGVALIELTQRRPMKTNGRHVYVMPAE